MRVFLLCLLGLLMGACATIEAPPVMDKDHPTQIKTYGISEGYVIRGPTIKRTSDGLVTCKSSVEQMPCEAFYAGGWEPFSAFFDATLGHISRGASQLAALFLGRSEIPLAPGPTGEFGIPEADAPLDRYGPPPILPQSRYETLKWGRGGRSEQ